MAKKNFCLVRPSLAPRFSLKTLFTKKKKWVPSVVVKPPAAVDLVEAGPAAAVAEAAEAPSYMSTPRTRRSAVAAAFTPTTPRVMIGYNQSYRCYLEPPVTVDETLGGDEVDVIDLSPVVTRSQMRKRRRLSTVTTATEKVDGAKRRRVEPFILLDSTGSTDPLPNLLQETPMSPEVLILAEKKRDDSATPRRSVRYKSPGGAYKRIAQTLKERLKNKGKIEKNKNNTRSWTRKVWLQPQTTSVVSPGPWYAGGGCSNPPSNFAFGLSRVEAGVFEFSGNQQFLLPPPRPMSNIYVPPSAIVPRQRGSLRPIVIDGSNVAVAHADSRGFSRRHFSPRGIDICIDYFRARGHTDIVAFVPQYRTKVGQTQDPEILKRLVASKKVVLTPARIIPGGRNYQVYDDRYIVQYAAVNGGVIVSNDNYRDLLHEGADMREAVEKRLLMYNWLRGDMLMFPEDPLGKSGPNLDAFLRF